VIVSTFRRDLAGMPWEELGRTWDVNLMVQMLVMFITIVLNVHAPVRAFRVHKDYIPQLPPEVKSEMRTRDSMRQRFAKSSGQEHDLHPHQLTLPIPGQQEDVNRAAIPGNTPCRYQVGL